MNKLAKYFSWKLPNSEKYKISEFCLIIENNLNIETWEFKYLYWGIKCDYEKLFNKIKNSKYWNNKINKILKYFDLPENFLYKISYNIIRI